MNTPNADGAISLKESMLEVEGWSPEIYQRNFNDFLDSQPYLVGTLMDADEGMEEGAHSWMLKAVLVLKWSFQKMGWRATMLSEEKMGWRATCSAKKSCWGNVVAMLNSNKITDAQYEG